MREHGKAMSDEGRSPSEKKILAFVESNRAAAVAMLGELVKVPSDNPPGDCQAHAERAARLYESLGFEVERHPVPADRVRAVGMISASNLVIRRSFGPGPVIALNAHGDVVAPGQGWSVDPYGAVIKDNFMYGRGVVTSKSDFATYAYALLALQEVAAELRGTVEIHLTYDEETGGDIGPLYLLQHGLTRPDLVICAGLAYGVVTAHNGCLHLEVDIRGKSAHAARPETGVDAIEAATHVMSALYGTREAFRSRTSAIEGITIPSLNIGLIAGGINTNVVPDQVSFRLDRRIIPEEDGDAVARELTAFIKQKAHERPGISCDVRVILLARPLRPLPGVERLANSLCRHASALAGETIRAHGVPLYTDARHYCNAGIPTVLYGAGPHSMLEANAHRADEKLNLDDLALATKVVALSLYDILSRQAP